MCRIYGYFGNQTISQEMLEEVALSQLNGGPDSRSFIAKEKFALGNNRLAIQGLDGGEQPFYLNNIFAVYNGEIYNHRELKQMLVQKGYQFNDDCDGSVILPLYELYGKEFVKYLDGMFCIAIVDNRLAKPTFLLANDQLAIKSVYYHYDHHADTFYFSSELKSLLSFPLSKSIRHEAVDEYLIGRALWHGKTFYEDIFELPPCHVVTKELGSNPVFCTYDSLGSIKTANEIQQSFEAAAMQLDNMLDHEVKQMLQADVPICLVTSGGLDSSYLTAIAKQHVENLTCFNIAYAGTWPSDERAYAKELADIYRIRYEQVLIEEQEFPFLIEKTIEHLGQPNSAPHAVSTYALFKAINQAGFKAAIAGEGADELFSGYERFRKAAVNPDANWFEPYFDKMCATTQTLRNSVYSDDYSQHLQSQPGLLKKAREKIEEKEGHLQSRLQALLQFDQVERFPSYILRRVDHLAMANSVEARVPFCQPHIVAYAKSLPDDFLADHTDVKKILYQAARDRLPASILKRPKQPFTLPIIAMLKKGHVLFDMVYETLTSTQFSNRGFFNTQRINELINTQLKAPNGSTADLLWSVMILERWFQYINSPLTFKSGSHEHV